MKPSWKDAPWWAEYRAEDKNGQWTWFQKHPKKYKGIWLPVDNSAFCDCVADKKWASTCEKRPKSKKAVTK